MINKKINEILPHRPPFLFVDSIVEFSNNSIIAKKTFKEDEEYFKGHFPGNPIVPGVILIECMAQSAGIIASQGLNDGNYEKIMYYLSRVIEVKFKHTVFPKDTIFISAEVLYRFDNFVKVYAVCKTEAKVVAEGELVLSNA